jgi:hypothetical protein
MDSEEVTPFELQKASTEKKKNEVAHQIITRSQKKRLGKGRKGAKITQRKKIE